jgi:hypothetical protein
MDCVHDPLIQGRTDAQKGRLERIVSSVNLFTVAGGPPTDIDGHRGRQSKMKKGRLMTARTIDQIRLLLFMAGIIGISIVIGITPTDCGSL